MFQLDGNPERPKNTPDFIDVGIFTVAEMCKIDPFFAQQRTLQGGLEALVATARLAEAVREHIAVITDPSNPGNN